jgi:hypothetical protein
LLACCYLLPPGDQDWWKQPTTTRLQPDGSLDDSGGGADPCLDGRLQRSGERGGAVVYQNRGGEEAPSSGSIWCSVSAREFGDLGGQPAGLRGFLFLLKKSQALDVNEINDSGVVRRFPSHRALIWSVYLRSLETPNPRRWRFGTRLHMHPI